MKKVLAGLVVAALAAAMMAVGLGDATASGAAGARCDEGRWPATVQGMPATFHAGIRASYAVWHDEHGWHLRTTTSQRYDHVFSGKIVSADDIRLVRQVRDEAADSVTVSGNEIAFRFNTHNGVDGIDFVVGCTESLTFQLKFNGRWMPSSRILLGRDGTARSNPFTVYRV